MRSTIECRRDAAAETDGIVLADRVRSICGLRGSGPGVSAEWRLNRGDATVEPRLERGLPVSDPCTTRCDTCCSENTRALVSTVGPLERGGLPALLVWLAACWCGALPDSWRPKGSPVAAVAEEEWLTAYPLVPLVMVLKVRPAGGSGKWCGRGLVEGPELAWLPLADSQGGVLPGACACGVAFALACSGSGALCCCGVTPLRCTVVATTVWLPGRQTRV